MASLLPATTTQMTTEKIDKTTETPTGTTNERPTLVVRPLGFVTVVIVSCVAVGLAIYWLIRSMHI